MVRKMFVVIISLIIGFAMGSSVKRLDAALGGVAINNFYEVTDKLSMIIIKLSNIEKLLMGHSPRR